MSEQTQTQLTEAQALDVIKRGVSREVRKDSERTMDYCRDSVKLQGWNVRKLAQKLEIKAEEAGESFNADSYQSNLSNANGIMGLFEFDIEKFESWLKESPTKSLKAIFNAFRQLFTDPKPAKPKPNKADAESQPEGEPTPLIDVVLSAIPHLTADERLMVKFLLDELDAAEHTPAETVAA